MPFTRLGFVVVDDQPRPLRAGEQVAGAGREDRGQLVESLVGVRRMVSVGSWGEAIGAPVVGGRCPQRPSLLRPVGCLADVVGRRAARGLIPNTYAVVARNGCLIALRRSRSPSIQMYGGPSLAPPRFGRRGDEGEKDS